MYALLKSLLAILAFQALVYLITHHRQETGIKFSPEKSLKRDVLVASNKNIENMEDPGRPKLPYTKKFTLDSTLQYSNDNFVNVLKDGTIFETRSRELQLKSVVALPEPKIFAHFASKAYQNQKDDETHEQFEERLQLPLGWKLLTTANNLAFLGAIRGYFGAVFWHPIHRRIVIAHRGTVPTNLDALRADLNGIIQNKYVKQMRAACTLTHRILEAVEECEKERNSTHFEIYFTGHSLGAWLAQVTAFSLYYLTLVRETFLKNPEGGRHSHTEVFDSPGSSETLQQMASDFDVRYSGKSTELGHLDITVYLSSPNFINCCNSHVGTLYRVYPKIESSDYFLYTLSSHSMDGILQIFNSSGPILMKEVVDWPKLDPTIWQWQLWKIHKSILGKEYEDFFELVKDSNYDPKLEDIPLTVNASSGSDNENSILNEFVTIRYQLKPIRANQCSPSVFAESELKFLRNFQQLKILPNSIFDGDANKKETIEKLLQLKIDDQSVSCDDNADIRQLIPYVKTLLRLYPGLNEEVELALTTFEIRKQIYRDLTESYRTKMKGLIEILQKSDWPRLDEFLQRQNQVCSIVAEIGTDFAAAKVLKTIDAKHANFTVFAFELQSLLTLETFFHLTEFLKSDELNETLILLECKSGSENGHFVQGVIDRVGEKPNLKLILITDKNEPFISNNNLQSIIDGGITWDELTNETKKHFITKEVIVFQGNNRSLEKLLRRTSTEMDWNHLAEIVDAETLARFLRDHKIIVGKNLTKPGHVYVTRKFVYKFYIKEEVFNHGTHDNVVAVSGINQKDLESGGIFSKKSNLLDGIKSGKVKMIQSDKDFEAFCSQNPRINVHWLKYESSSFVFHMTRGSQHLLCSHIDDQMSKEFSEEELLERGGDRRTVIISDVPGMGKTTVLSALATKIKKKNPEQWVVRVNLNDCTETLETAIQIETVSDAVRFLVDQILPRGKDTKLISDFEKRLFERALMIGGGVVLIFDGFDEISPKYEGTVTGLLELLQRTKVDLLVVTTRPHTKDRLEDSLFTFSYSMVSFSEENYKELLLKIWKNRDDGTYEEKDLEKYADESIEFLEKSIKDREKSFLGIPLHCTLLAEYLWEKFLEGEHRELKVLSLFDLYEAFIRSKTNIYYEEKHVNIKGNTGAENQKKYTNIFSRKMYHQCAIKIILSGDKWDEFDFPEMEGELKETTENAVLKLGLMTNTGVTPQFLHRTFAEFFVLDYTLSLAARNVKENWKKLTILSRAILLKREFSVVRAFLESLIKNGNKAAETENVLRSFVEFWSQNWSTNPTDCLTEDEGTVLHRLLQENLESTFTLLIGLMSEISPTEIPTFQSTTTKEESALQIALRNENANIALSMLQGIPDIISDKRSSLLKLKRIIDAEDSRGYTALHVASELGQIQIVRALLENGAYINAIAEDGYTALGEALLEGHLDIVRFLVENGADINACGRYGQTVLGMASSGGHLDIVTFLVQNGADINNGCEEYVSSALSIAVPEGHLEIVRFLVKQGADINVHGATYLGEALTFGHLKIFDFLLEQGADINGCGVFGYTLLERASNRGRLEDVRFLLQKGADVNKPSEFSTSLHEASREGHLDVAELLISNGANVNSVDAVGRAPLHMASSKGHLGIAELLISNGANVNSVDVFGHAPLHEASWYGKVDLVRLLLKNGADIDVFGPGFDTLWRLAAKEGHWETMFVLIEHGINLANLALKKIKK